MSHLVVINLGTGDLQGGCASVVAQVSNRADHQYPMQYLGSLPPAPELAQLYRRWQLLYQEFYRERGTAADLVGVEPDLSATRAITISTSGVTHFSEVEFSDLAQQLRQQLNIWLNAESFHSIDRKLSRLFDPANPIQVMIQTNDPVLRRLPWHLWNFFEDFPQAEVTLSLAAYERIPDCPQLTGAVRILALLGDSHKIDIQSDRRVIEALPNAAPLFLSQPSPAQLHEHLWDHRGWDILFFAGHSRTEAQFSGETGRLYINSQDSLTLDQLRNGLRRAIRQGLKLAIFNSCDGLGLAQALADLHIPQVIVMREIVPDAVAQAFFREFLSQFASGQSLCRAVREAREKLEQFEGEYPCATWLPLICQNPAEEPMQWRQQQPASSATPPETLPKTLSEALPQESPEDPSPENSPENSPQKSPSASSAHKQLPKLLTTLLTSLLVTASALGIRHLGGFQAWELRAFDPLMRLRPAEPPDSRMLLVTITDQDVQQQNAQDRRGASLSDQALAQLLNKLQPHQPRVIGLDLYRDFPIDPASGLATQLQQTPQFVAVCEVGTEAGTQPLAGIPKERLSFSDLPIDSDGVVRRQILGMAASPNSFCVTDTAFSLRLAQLYLSAQGIQTSRDASGILQIGKTRFPPLRSESGGYHQLDALGYQVMLNYRAAHPPAAQVTLGDILSGRLDSQLADLVRDRLVLIGTVAPSFKDYFLTPYSQSDPMQKMPGVVVQTQMTSQILSAVLDQRPLLGSLPSWGVALWIWGWAGLGAGLIYWRSPWVGLAGAAAIVTIGGMTIGGISYGCLLQGVWLPAVPAAFGFVVAYSSGLFYKLWIPKWQSNRST
ncbi:MAG: CHASE2 domain-containing protein [Pegethrix bostrychoides GSE-TBD4-15B]|jgi:CHASE2 domain-containing sensor protein|uniref:CHASE2 domain-containing protein n=1 Tax=Pegethrix bostrychoides GSE-TBD4-15B TaxID=2839662 RepID=A0A951PEV6_9CYAN|nr:CHASE2 domain-containing protein [Pegethrix bostrychoides GSE-TBD4-15B]